MVNPYHSHQHKGLSSPFSDDTCTPMFIAALLTIASTQNQDRYPSINYNENAVNLYNGVLFSK